MLIAIYMFLTRLGILALLYTQCRTLVVFYHAASVTERKEAKKNGWYITRFTGVQKEGRLVARSGTGCTKRSERWTFGPMNGTLAQPLAFNPTLPS